MTARVRRGSRLGFTTAAIVFILLIFSPVARGQQTVILNDPTFLALRGALFSGVSNQVGTLPNPTGGAFTFELDPTLGVFRRTTDSLGPIFSQRADTTGHNKFTITASYTHHTFDEVDGIDVRKGVQVPLIVGNVFGTRLNVLEFRDSVDADVGTFSVLYGLTDRIDVGVIVPIVSVTLKERVRRTGFIDCAGPPQRNLENCSNFVPRNDPLIPQDSESTGVGDVVLTSKYNFWRSGDILGGHFGLAAGLDVKLPTGDTGDRRKLTGPGVIQFVGNSTRVVDSFIQLGDPPRGTGIVRVKPQLIASGSWFGFEPHVNIGAELGKTSGITNDLVYAVGVDYTLFGRVTLVADLLGRHAFDVQRRELTPNIGAGGTANADTITGSFGLKANPIGTLIVFLNFLIPLNDTGARDDLTPTFGLEWSF